MGARILTLLGVAVALTAAPGLAGHGSAETHAVVAQSQTAPGEERIVLRDTRLDGAPLSRYFQAYLPKNGPLAVPKRDPKFNREYRLRCVVRVWDVPDGEQETVFYVHYTAVDDEPLARRVARALAHLFWLARDYLDMLPPKRQGKASPVNVWLSRDGQPGAEEFDGDIYLYAVTEDRAPAEWVRELAHEYSHIVVPPYGPFTAPEKLANGYMGERLLMKWLVDNGLTELWGQGFLGASYVSNQVTPLMHRFLNAGPGSADARRSDAAGMEHLIGFALALETAYGPRFLRDAFRRSPSTTPSGLGAGAAEAMRMVYDREIRLDSRGWIPEHSKIESSGRGGIRATRAAYWLFLPAGTWRLAAVGDAAENLSVQVDDGRVARSPSLTAGSANFQIDVIAASWRRLVLSSRGGEPFEISHLRLQRQSQ